ncbi:RNA 2',3'-cyclic phosphodiesterase [Parashewanella curva]|uniref:RNA 2',3'-cyclic phosphodiesterase n=1 Tax=Parashewanella curva TaxID=2338552 RepID=A0A3L8Q260_9GAMM|nr:RNA 2',3'-cyclic phosphodiesterase [Parashewanella curva]RLV60938.1 RNA 2',3'-cyclic phosphodiesterase [Parashewanella curva]
MTDIAKRRRIFIGIMCPDDVWQPWQQRVAALGYAPLLEQPHITLAFLGGLTNDELTQVITVLNRIQPQTFVQNVAGGGYFSLKRQTILWAKVASSIHLSTLREQILTALQPINLQFETKFVPHISLVRAKSLPRVDCEKFVSQVNDLTFDFTVDGFGIYESMPINTHPRYQLVDKISLK